MGNTDKPAMADTTHPAATRPWGVVAEFDSASAIYRAAEATTAHGYTRVDAHTPFAVHGLDRALRQGPSPLGWIVLTCGITGVCLAQLMMPSVLWRRSQQLDGNAHG